MADDPTAAASGGELDNTLAAGDGNTACRDADTLLGASAGGSGNNAATGAAAGGRDNAGVPAGQDGAAAPAGRDDGKAGDKATDVDPADRVPDTPEGYTLTFADGTRVDAALLDGFKSTAHAAGLTLRQSQTLAALYEKHVAEMDDAAQQAQREALDKAQGEWEAEIKGDKDFEENYAHARRALRQFGSPELTTVMNQTRIGSFPAFFTFVAAVGKALAEPAFKGAYAGYPGKSLGRILYPDMR
ncbi:MAG: hypothetical protein LBR82_09460 [Desulfovibrio sp.]|jgi:hypothetical protein|nr:hypothetical protein [Desulfovibrio sp.]